MSSLQFDLFSPPRRPIEHHAARLPYSNPFLDEFAERLAAAGDSPLTWDEDRWNHGLTRTALGLDVEVYRNFFVLCLKRFSDGTRLAFERSERTRFDVAEVERMLRSNTIITFNGNSYDLAIVTLALTGATTRDLKLASDQIIRGEMKPWDVEKTLGVKTIRLNHVDLMEPNPSVRSGLKTLAGRLHCRFLVDLPVEPDAVLTPREMNVLTLYCQYGDLDATEKLYESLREPLELRVALAKRYGLGDLRSRSDSQVGETIITHRLGARGRATGGGDEIFGYEVPSFISFTGQHLRDLVSELATTQFQVGINGKIMTPPVLENLLVPLGPQRYSMGIGGLHSTESNRAVTSNHENVLIDVDVASQYPNIIRKLGIYPPALGPRFLDVYGELVDERLAAKVAGDKVVAEGLKLSANGVYGKLGSAYSLLYAPKLLIATTLTGQLAILMLIERAEEAGIPAISANTDGVVFNCPRTREDLLGELLASWERDTGFVTERTRYRALYSSSVNTYLAIREDGKVKRKGPIADPWSENDLRGMMSKNPQMTVCSEAALRFIDEGLPVDVTIYGEDDPRKFVTVIRVSSGGSWRGNYLGKIVRYYWSVDGDPILTKQGSRVSKTDGARPMIMLPDVVPTDVDRLRYCEEAYRLLTDLGATP